MALAIVLSVIALAILAGSIAYNVRGRVRSRRLDDANFFGYAADRHEGRDGDGPDGDGGD